jgi:hypothetical protein
VAKYAKLLLGCFRTGDATDPEVYTRAVVMVLADYPDDVIERVVDPRTGIPSRMNWLPTIAEIKSACEDIEGPRRRIREWEERAALQIEARKQLALTDGRSPEEIQRRVEEIATDTIRRLGPGLRKGYVRFDGDGGHAARVAADIAMRKARHEAGNA